MRGSIGTHDLSLIHPASERVFDLHGDGGGGLVGTVLLRDPLGDWHTLPMRVGGYARTWAMPATAQAVLLTTMLSCTRAELYGLSPFTTIDLTPK